MGFFAVGKKIGNEQALLGASKEFLHKHQCAVCPLNHIPDNRHPHMTPTGATQPLIYMLGEAPGETEDRKGIPFVGAAGQVLRFRLPEWVLPHLRWSNVVRTRPPKNREPAATEIECCRPSIELDIATTKPWAIFGFGNVPLHWACGGNGIVKWAGRRFPIRIRDHTCWFYPMMDPLFIMRSRRFIPRTRDKYGSELEFAFAHHLRTALQDAHDWANNPDTPSATIPHTRERAEANLELIDGSQRGDLERVRELLYTIGQQTEPVGLDYETNCERPLIDGAKILTAAISSPHRTMAIAFYHHEAAWSESDLNELDQIWADFLHNSKCPKVSHGLTFEQEWSAYFWGEGCVRSPWEDTLNQAYVLDERQGMLSLEMLCIQYFGINIKAITNTNKKRLDQTPIKIVLKYNAIDARYHRLLFHAQAKRLKVEGLLQVYREQRRQVPTLVLTQLKGVPIDQDIVEEHFVRYIAERTEVERKLAELPSIQKYRQVFGVDFRPSTPQDVFKLFNRVLRVPIESTDESILSKIKRPEAQLTLEWRSVHKLISTYVLPVMEAREETDAEPAVDRSPLLYSDGHAHPQYHLTKVVTSRTSSDGPNIQNWPKRENKHIRRQAKPGGDLRVVSFDFAGIQARNVAMESRDRTLTEAFWNRYDIHTDWLERLVKLYPKWATPKQLVDKAARKKLRDRAKNELVFPSFFGARPQSIAKYLGIPENIAQTLHEDFWDSFPEIKNWHEQLFSDLYELGYVTGLSGVRRRAPVSPNELINAPIQADEKLIVLRAMCRLSEMEEPRFQATLEVHDDLTFIWPKHEIEKNSEVVITEMLRIDFPWINVPLGVERSIGEDWGSTQGAGEYYSDKLGLGPERKDEPK